MDNVIKPEAETPVFKSTDIHATKAHNQGEYFVKKGKTPFTQKAAAWIKAHKTLALFLIIIVLLISLGGTALYIHLLEPSNPNNPGNHNIIENAEASDPESVKELEQYRMEKYSEFIEYSDNYGMLGVIDKINSELENTKEILKKNELQILKAEFYRLGGNADRTILMEQDLNLDKFTNEQKSSFYHELALAYMELGDDEKTAEFFEKSTDYITGSITQIGGD